jgi:transcriptional regulator with XRE-family HTH domain
MRAIDAGRAVRDFGRRVGEERARRRWTQAEFAERIGVSVRYVQHIEAGTQNVSIASAVRLANALHVPLTSLFEPPSSRRPQRGRPRTNV